MAGELRWSNASEVEFLKQLALFLAELGEGCAK